MADAWGLVGLMTRKTSFAWVTLIIDFAWKAPKWSGTL